MELFLPYRILKRLGESMFRNIITSLLVALVVSSCAKRPEPQDSCGFVQNQDLQRVSWKGDVPVYIYIHEGFPSQYRFVVQNAVNQWNRVAGRTILAVGGIVNGTNAPNSMERRNVIYWRTDGWDPNKPLEQGRTTIHWESTKIFKADMIINAYSITYSATSSVQPGTVDLESLIVHELGHVLGLNHNNSDGSVMAEKLPTSTARRSVLSQDAQNLNCEY